ncbi:amino acid transporter [Halovulum dunhuangense]|uniref:Amino acid transporter n=1 Tax=Halovulum dunhuangense TaxID=1505036 RepID=A0A849L360_9RHOB|nr:amino acid transporter [Halovulum dunhuangense]
MISAAATGYGTSLALILAIGAQNAFVLRQGLMRSHVLAVVLVCAISDALLIAAGVAGFAAVTAAWPALPRIMALGGAAFLLVYGFLRLRAAWRGGEALVAGGERQSLRSAVLTCLAFTWANPHVYLDTLGLIGAVSTAFGGPAKLAFGIGAVAASFSFFFALGYGARLLAPLMRRPGAWRVLDTAIGLTMWAIAASLVF